MQRRFHLPKMCLLSERMMSAWGTQSLRKRGERKVYTAGKAAREGETAPMLGFYDVGRF